MQQLYRSLLWCALVAGCGDQAVRASADAADVDAPACAARDQMPRYVGGGSVGPVSWSSTITIPTTHAGDLIAVSIATLSDVASPPHPQIDASGYRLEPEVYEGNTSCARGVWMWSITKVPNGVTHVDLPWDDSSSYVAYVQLFSGFRAEARTSLADNGLMMLPADDVARAPEQSACPGDVVVSTIASCGTLTGIAATNPFALTGMIDGTSSAFATPAAPGKYGAEWTQTVSPAAAITVVFH